MLFPPLPPPLKAQPGLQVWSRKKVTDNALPNPPRDTYHDHHERNRRDVFGGHLHQILHIFALTIG